MGPVSHLSLTVKLWGKYYSCSLYEDTEDQIRDHMGSQSFRLECAFFLLLSKIHLNLILWFPCFILVNKKFQGELSILNVLLIQWPVDCEHELFSLVPDQDIFLLPLEIQGLNMNGTATESFTGVMFTYIHATETQICSDWPRTGTYQGSEMMALGLFKFRRGKPRILILHF